MLLLFLEIQLTLEMLLEQHLELVDLTINTTAVHLITDKLLVAELEQGKMVAALKVVMVTLILLTAQIMFTEAAAVEQTHQVILILEELAVEETLLLVRARQLKIEDLAVVEDSSTAEEQEAHGS